MVQQGAQEVRLTNIQYYRIIVVELIICLFAAFGIGFSILEYEYKDAIHSELYENLILGYNTFCSFALVLSMYSRYQLYLEWFKARSLLTEYDTLISTGWW